MSSILQDGGSSIKGGYGIEVPEFTAATTYDNVQHTLLTADRLNFDSMQVRIDYLISLTADKTLNATVVLQDCATAQGSYTTYATIADDVTIQTGAVTAEKDVYEINYDLSGCKRYIKVLASLDLSHSGTDTCQAYMGYTLTGARSIPVS